MRSVTSPNREGVEGTDSDDHCSIGDTAHVRLLERKCCVFPSQKGTLLLLLATGFVSLRIAWDRDVTLPALGATNDLCLDGGCRTQFCWHARLVCVRQQSAESTDYGLDAPDLTRELAADARCLGWLPRSQFRLRCSGIGCITRRYAARYTIVVCANKRSITRTKV